MSNDIPVAYQTMYDATVKQEYQDEMRLKPSLRIRNNVEGDKATFRTFGRGVAKPRGPLSSDVPVMNNKYYNTVATLSDWTASDYTDIFAQAKVNFDEMKEQAQSSAFATGRRCDQLVIDALDDATVPAAAIIAKGTTGLTFAKVRQARKVLKKQSCGKDDLYFVISADEEDALLGEEKATSGDYVGTKPIPEGSLDGNKWMGFTWIVLGDRDEGGLPEPSATERTCFAYKGGMKGTPALAIGIDFKNTADWIAHKKSWLVGTDFSAGAVAVGDPAAITGLIQVGCVIPS